MYVAAALPQHCQSPGDITLHTLVSCCLLGPLIEGGSAAGCQGRQEVLSEVCDVRLQGSAFPALCTAGGLQGTAT